MTEIKALDMKTASMESNTVIDIRPLGETKQELSQIREEQNETTGPHKEKYAQEDIEFDEVDIVKNL